METYLAKGYSKAWINQRLKSIEVRKELTDEWEKRGIKKGFEFAVLTDIITKAWSEKTVKEYKKHKGLKKENPHDHMTNLELVLNMLAEATSSEISKEKKPSTLVMHSAAGQFRCFEHWHICLPHIPPRHQNKQKSLAFSEYLWADNT
jgi:hypothetical protein